MSEVSQRLSRANQVAVISHVHPDGDAVGSLSALTLALASLGKKVTPVLADAVPESFLFIGVSTGTQLPGVEDVDLCVVLDAPDMSRTGRTEEIRAFAAAGKLVMIDHHPAGDLRKASLASIYNTEASSCAELLFDVIVDLGARITPEIATALLVGMYTDTGGFQQSNTTSRVLEQASELLKRGAKLQKIVHELHRHQSVAHLKLTGIALERIATFEKGMVTASYLTHEDLVGVGAVSDDCTGIIGELNVLPGSQWALLIIEETPGNLRGILRTAEDSNLPVNRLARLLGGGGHPRASGFSLPGRIAQTAEGWQLVAPEA